MEASAIYSIAKARKVRAVSIFIVSDVLDIEVWEPHFHHKILKSQYQRVLEVICKHWGSGQ